MSFRLRSVPPATVRRVSMLLALLGCESAGGLVDPDATLLRRDAGPQAGAGGTGSGPPANGGIELDIPDVGPAGGDPGPVGGDPTPPVGGEGAGGFDKPDAGPLPETDAAAAGGSTADATRPPEADAGPMGCVPAPELCNGLDDDCDGAIDEMFLGTGEACDTGRPGLCARGVRRCEAGVLTCEGLEPGVEVCDNQDNDCDAETDEDDGQGGACNCRGGLPLVVLEQVCDGGGAGTSHVAACAEGAELHIFSAYESAGRNGFVDVTITRTGAPLVLVFSSYEPATWRVALGDGVVVQQVILNGYNAQFVEGLPADVPVVDRAGAGNYLVACAYLWPVDDGGCDTPGLVMGAEGLAGVPLTTFQACYGAQSFLLANQ